MNIILITRPDFFSAEAETINALFRRGLPLLHLRKPQATSEEVDALISQIDREFRDRIVRHNHDLHSCHTLEEVMIKKQKCTQSDLAKAQCSYVFLSPIFDSISKQGYHAAFTKEQLLKAHQDGIIDDKVIALGGITPDNARKAMEMGFGGVAILGDVWQSDDPVEQLGRYLTQDF
ncbi:MAG: thiamine phosphate synthase [Bacteroidaceae bacterium]|nr:thiamine phosphate synthase [Bacteroidaceae bacterium]